MSQRKRKAADELRPMAKRRKLCEFPDCGIKPSFGTEQGQPRFCRTHQVPGMHNVTRKRCEFPGCGTRPNFGTEQGQPRFCSTHQWSGMRDVVNNFCEYADCVRWSSFGTEQGQPRFCQVHQLPGMRNVVKLPGMRDVVKLPGMRDMVNKWRKLCEIPDCGKHPSFGTEQGQPRFCQTHQLPGMRSVVNKRCEFPDCGKQPSFGTEQGQPRFCSTHQLPGMRDVKNKRCEYPECGTNPYFGTEQGKPRFCKTHQLPGMRDVVNKRCEFSGCGALPSFGTERGQPRFCSTHQLPGMCSVTGKRCEFPDCVTRAWYGHPGHPVTRCATHKEPNMLPYSNRRCVIPQCRETAVFGTLRRQLHCEAHAVAGEVNLVEQRCDSCGLLNIVHPMSRKCADCDPAQKVIRPVKWKELDVKAVLALAGWADAIHDRRLQDSCGLRDRPDFVIDAGFCWIVIECDEHQHRDRMCARRCECPRDAARHCQCQQARLVDLGQVLGMPQVWLRFNPDPYRTASGSRGPTAPARRRQELARMVNFVARQDITWLQGAFTRACYMYYDGDDIQWETLV